MTMYKQTHELSCDDGCILWSIRVIVPTVHRSMFMEELHETHPDISRIKGLARNYVWWLSMDMDLETILKYCHSCQVNQHAPAKAPLHPWECTANSLSRLRVDFAVPFMGRMFLVIMDSHNKRLEVFQMQNITSQNTVERLGSCFATHGQPDCVVNDNGPTFTSD